MHQGTMNHGERRQADQDREGQGTAHADLGGQAPDDFRARLLLGFEPFPSRRETFEVAGHSFPAEVQEYWLERGISLLLSAKLIHRIERLESGQAQARYLAGTEHRLHAKLYVGDQA
jgi:hypothetical protein